MCPIQCVPKKEGMRVVPNERNGLISTRTVTEWRVCMDYKKLNKATHKDHLLLPFHDQMLDCLINKEFIYFLNGYSGYDQLTIASNDQEKTTSIFPCGTFSLKYMPSELCNAPTSFKHYIIVIFSNLIKKCIEVIMDNFLVFGKSFDACLENLDLVLK